MVATVTVVRRRLRDAALSRNGRLEEIDREYTALCVCVCVAVQACASIVRPTNSCIHVSRATLISFKGEARRNRLVQWQMEEGCKPAEIYFCNLNLFGTEFTVDRLVCGPI